MRPIGTWPLVFFLLFAVSCATMKQPSLKIDHYTLEYASPRPGDLPKLPVILKIERFRVASVYDTRQIVYRDKSFKREAYTYHRWRSHPADLVTDFLTRDMRQSGLFEAVAPPGSKLPPTHILEGSLDEFFEWNAAEGWKAVLTLSATLVNAGGPDRAGRIIFQRTLHATQTYQEQTPRGLAKAMSEAMCRVSEELMKTVYEHLSAADH